jgi:NarL family two-component system response regulator LiaR
MIRVLLADDREAVRAGVAQFLANYDDMEVVGQAADGAQAVGLSRETNPDVVLMDLVMPEMDGIEATRQILSSQPDTRIIVFTVFSERHNVFRAMDAGAIGYLMKGSDPDELVRGIRAAMGGESAFGPEATRVIVSRAG